MSQSAASLRDVRRSPNRHRRVVRHYNETRPHSPLGYHHEAGHLVMTILLSIFVKEAAIDPNDEQAEGDEDDSGKILGNVITSEHHSDLAKASLTRRGTRCRNHSPRNPHAIAPGCRHRKAIRRAFPAIDLNGDISNERETRRRLRDRDASRDARGR